MAVLIHRQMVDSKIRHQTNLHKRRVTRRLIHLTLAKDSLLLAQGSIQALGWRLI